jgi:DNA-binding GntR family transcriptional regulator
MEQVLKAPSYGEVIANRLREAIVRGELRPGQELRQAHLAESMGVSRIPVRDALLALEHDGLVTMGPSRRMVVANLSDEDILDHYSIRALLEGEAASRAAGAANLMALLEAHDSVAHTPGAHEFVAANRVFHRAIWDAADSPQLISVTSKLWTGLAPHTPYLLPTQIQQSVMEHQRIMDAIVAGDGEEARVAMNAHVMRSAQELIAFRHGSAPS